MEEAKKNVVVIGGGTGTSLLLGGLKKYPLCLRALVTTADTGGSSGVLRRETGMAPPGDVRQCFVALNEDAHPIVATFNERFTEGALKGHSFGNLFFALLWQRYRDFPKAVREAEEMFGASHRVIPLTHEPTNLVAVLKNGSSISSEENIIQQEGLCEAVERFELEPADARLNAEAREAIAEADVIILGPGNLVGSLVPPLLVHGLVEAVAASDARKVYVANLLNQVTTRGFGVEEHLAFLQKVAGEQLFDTVIYNTGEISAERIAEAGVQAQPITLGERREDVAYIGEKLVAPTNGTPVAGDGMVRSLIKHDQEKIASLLYERLINGE